MPPIAAAVIGLGTAVYASSQQKKAQERAEEFAASQQQQAIDEQRRLEEKFGLTPGELARSQRLFGIAEGEEKIGISEGLEERRQKELERRAGLSGEDLLREQGGITRGLLDTISGRQGRTGEELFLGDTGEIGRKLVDEIGGFDESLFRDELSVVLDEVRKQANRRGVLSGLPEGGIGFEQLGRAGVDLAVNKARERIEQRKGLAQAFLSLSQGARAEAGTVGSAASEESRGARSELDQFLGQLQNLDLSAKGRAAQTATSAAGIFQPSISSFGSVPIDFSAARFGEAGGIKRQGLEALGDIAGTYLGNIFRTKKETEKSGIDEPLQDKEIEDILRSRYRGIIGAGDQFLGSRDF